MTTEQTLPITEFIDKSIDFAEFNSRISYTDWLSEVKSLEEAQQKKAKEEERERTLTDVVGILEEMVNEEHTRQISYNTIMKLQEAITRIKFNT